MKWLSTFRVLLSIGVLLVAIIASGFVFQKPLTKAFMPHIVRAAMSKKNVLISDGLYAGLCGTGSPMPDAHRAGPCITVMAGGHFFIVDAGEGSTKNILLMKLPIREAEAILLTHFHSDHIADLGEMELQRWVGGSHKTPIDIIGPTGVERVVEGFNLAYQLDAGYRVAHHGPETVPPKGAGGIARSFALSDAPDASAVVYDKDSVKITAFKVDHRPVTPAVGYRFDYKGRSLVISGDTVYSDSLLEHTKDADVLFHEALNTAMVQLMNDNAGETGSPSLAKVTHDIPSYHSTPEDAAKIAHAANVKHLIYYHIVPPLPSTIFNRAFLGNAKNYYKGPITIGKDGMVIFLPPNSDRIEIKKVLR
jgi:ribonuclease Z